MNAVKPLVRTLLGSGRSFDWILRLTALLLIAAYLFVEVNTGGPSRPGVWMAWKVLAAIWTVPRILYTRNPLMLWVSPLILFSPALGGVGLVLLTSTLGTTWTRHAGTSDDGEYRRRRQRQEQEYTRVQREHDLNQRRADAWTEHLRDSSRPYNEPQE